MDVAAKLASLLGQLNTVIVGKEAQVRECVARQFFRSSSGRNDTTVTNAEQSFVDSWKQLPADSQGKFVEVLVAYVRSPLFDSRSAQ